MILYLDTSSLVKLYVQEDGSEVVAALVRTSEITASSIVAYAEARSAFARRFREGAFTPSDYDAIKRFFKADWRRYLACFLSQTISELAGDLAEAHSLRGFDSIHLASALNLQHELPVAVVFSSFDNKLQKAAHDVGLKIPHD